MKPQFIVLSLICILASTMLSAENKAARDYWPTAGWKSSTAELQGLDPKKLEELSIFIQDEMPMTTSVLFVRHGYIVFEYYALDDPEKARMLWSVTKSVLSALVGIALREGYINSVDQPIFTYFPEYTKDIGNQKSKGISIRHLLTMSSGIAEDEHSQEVRPDVFTKKLRNDPGAEFFYNELGPQLLSIVITKTTGLSAFDFARKYVFEPINISSATWSLYETGGVVSSQGGVGLRMTTRDLAKFGYLYLNNGIWDNNEVIPSDWVSDSTKKQIDVPESLWYFTKEYGFFWWIRSVERKASYTAFGWQGQFLYVIPNLDIVAVITALDPDNESPYLRIIDDYIIPSGIK